MHAWNLVYDIVLLLAAAMVLGAVFESLRQNAILGYLLAGTLLGPKALHLVDTAREVEAIAELGVALLLFSLGLDFSWKRVRQFGVRTLVAGIVQVCVTGIIATAVAMPVLHDWREATIVGAMIALSSTACVLRVLVDRTELESVHGRQVLGVLLVQDMAVVPLAMLVAALAGDGSGSGTAGSISTRILIAAGLTVVLFLVLNYAGVRVLQSRAMLRNRDLAVLLAVVAGMGSAWAAHSLGLSPALGTFVAGMALGASPLATQIRSDVAPVRIALLTLFFASVGVMADPAFILEHPGTVAAVTAGLIVGKTMIVWAIMRCMRLTSGRAAATGLCLAQVGEFSFVLANLAGDTGLRESTVNAIASSAILSLMATPYLIGAAPRLAAWLDRRQSPAATTDSAGPGHPASEVVIIGFGPAGERVAVDQASAGRTPLVVDLNPGGAARASAIGADFHVGDATRREVLDRAGIKDAKVVVVTLPTPRVALQVCQLIRRLAPQAYLIVRARYHRHAGEFESLGAHAIVDEEQRVGHHMAAKIADFFETSGGAEKGAVF